jgi:hypothetical protein
MQFTPVRDMSTLDESGLPGVFERFHHGQVCAAELASDRQ